MTCGIYMITNKKTDQKYIGQSLNIEKRWGEHCSGYNCGHSYIDDAIKKYGNINFSLSIICELENDTELLNEMEKYYIWKHDTYENKKHYNLTPGGDFNPMKVPEIAQKISNLRKGMHFTEEHKKNISLSKRGKKNPNYNGLSKEHKDKISKAQKGEKGFWYNKSFSQEHRDNISESVTKYSLWDTKCVHYDKYAMCGGNRTPNPCSCFAIRYNAKRLNGMRFIDFITPLIIVNIVKKEDIL